MNIGIGIEGTFAPHCGSDTLSVTGHFTDEQWMRDLELVQMLGIAEVRYPIPWHLVEHTRGLYCWEQVDPVLAYAQALGLRIIADPLHHTSHPAWLRSGLHSVEMIQAYPQFVAAFARRYPLITHYTPFNEPTCTLDFAGQRGWWHPYGKGDASYVAMLRITARATARAVAALRREAPDAWILHVDTFEHHSALDRASVGRAEFLNERRFLFEELLTGRVGSAHPLAAYLLVHGFAPADLDWHRAHPVCIDERGGNYYPLSEEQLENGHTRHAPSRAPLGFAGVVHQYAARLPYPLSLTETNIQGSVRDRVSWLKYMLEQAEGLARAGIGLNRFSWYPLFDCAGWQCLLQPRWTGQNRPVVDGSKPASRRLGKAGSVY